MISFEGGGEGQEISTIKLYSIISLENIGKVQCLLLVYERFCELYNKFATTRHIRSA